MYVGRKRIINDDKVGDGGQSGSRFAHHDDEVDDLGRLREVS
jgi:hypothetical protein